MYKENYFNGNILNVEWIIFLYYQVKNPVLSKFGYLNPHLKLREYKDLATSL